MQERNQGSKNKMKIDRKKDRSKTEMKNDSQKQNRKREKASNRPTRARNGHQVGGKGRW